MNFYSCKLYMRFLCALSLLLLTSYSQEQERQVGAISLSPLTSIENKDFIQSLKNNIEKSPNNPVAKMQTDNPQNALLAEEITVTKFVVTNNQKPQECADKVVRFLRSCYVASDIDPIGPVYVGSGPFISPGELPVILYLYTGKTDGLFEYTKLSGLYANDLDIFWENGRKWNDSKLLSYRIYALQRDQFAISESYYLSKRVTYDPQIVANLKRLVQDFGTQNKQLGRFLVDFAFGEQSYIRLAANAKEIGLIEKAPEEKQLLVNYYQTVIRGTSWEPEFLLKAARYYNVHAQEMFGIHTPISVASEPQMQTKVDIPNTPKIGKSAPQFVVMDSFGKRRSLEEIKGKKNLLLTFFPKCFTGGCANHLSSLRDVYSLLQKTNTEVWAVSVDPADGSQGQIAFAEKWHLPFPLIPDINRTVCMLYGSTTSSDQLSSRQSVYINKTGIVEFVDRDVHVTTHGADVLAKIKQLGWK